MQDRFSGWIGFGVCTLLWIIASTVAFAQGSAASSLSALVVDAGGQAVPGASIEITNTATGVTVAGVSNSKGRFAAAGLAPGTYTVAVSNVGFKSYVAADVVLNASRPREITAKLEVGPASEIQRVTIGSALVETVSPSLTGTVTAGTLTRVPLASRNALYSLTMLPGVSAPGNDLRRSLIYGLPNNTINIAIDGISSGNALESGDGFYSMVSPRIDAVNAVTVTGAVPGVGAGPGSTQVAFVTRSGSNQLDGSAYLYWGDPKINSNYYFNEVNGLAKNDARLRTWGARVGGPVILPGYNGRGKAFFFLNFEHEHLNSSVTRTRTILSPAAQSGLFTYDRVVNGATIQQQFNLLDEARKRGYTSTVDPAIGSTLARIGQATASRGAIVPTTDRNLLHFVFQSEATSDQYAPTGRFDYNLTDKHRVTATYYWQRFKNTADLLNNRDAAFPGLPNHAAQQSHRTLGSFAVRSSVSSNMVNEFRAGFQQSPIELFDDATKEQFDITGGYAIAMPLITDIWTTNDPRRRNTKTWSANNDLTWLVGSHHLLFGGSFAGVRHQESVRNLVPQLSLGLDAANDPAAAMFASGIIQGASNSQLAEARDLYALLTGRVTSVAGAARLDAATGRYVYLGNLEQKSRMNSVAAYASDTWRARPTLTLTWGVRWDVQFPFSPGTNTFSTATLEDVCGISGVGGGPGGRPCKMFQPGTVGGKAQPEYTQFAAGSDSYKTNWRNIGYSLGFAWRPNIQDGAFRRILGNPDHATIRGGYSLTYNVERIDRFNAGNNPGGEISVTRDNASSSYCLVCAGETFPVLLSQTNRLGPPAFPATRVYPIAATTAGSVNIMSPHLRTPRVQSYSIGLERSLGENTALELRYVGSRSRHTWTSENWNERVIFENGFYDEFLLARANLAANRAAGLGNTFAYTGVPGTSPLPIHQAYLAGRSDANNPTGYAGITQYTNPAFINRLSIYQPEVAGAAAALDQATFRANAINAGLAANFFVMNPSVSSANVMTDGGGTKYNSIQASLRRRLSKGLMVGASYAYTRQYATSLQSLRLVPFEVNDTRQPHEFKLNFIYEIPVGHGRRFNLHPILNGIFGNWEFSGNARIQTARFRITNAKLVGMTADELSREFKIRVNKDAATGVTTVYSLPADIILNTRAAYSTDPTQPNGYSAALGAPTGRYIKPSSDASCVAIYRADCNAPDIEINGPLYKKVDLRLTKLIPFGGRGSFEVNFEALNAFANVNFNHNLTPGGGPGTFQVTSAATNVEMSGDPGGRVGQIIFRIHW